MSYVTENSSSIVVPIAPGKPAGMTFAQFKDGLLLQITADTTLPTGFRLVGTVLVAHLNHERPGHDAYPGFKELRKKTGFSRRYVIEAIKALEAAGHFRVRRSRARKKNNVNVYYPVLKTAGVVNYRSPRSELQITTPSELQFTRTEELTEDITKRESAAPDGAAPHTNDSANSAKRGGREEGESPSSSDNPLSPTPSQRSHRGSRLSEDWKLSPEDEAFASNGLNAEAIGVEAEKFRNYWIAAPGQKGIKRDWPATWRNWCLGSKQWNPGKAAEAKPRLTEDQINELLERHQRKQGLTAGSSMEH